MSALSHNPANVSNFFRLLYMFQLYQTMMRSSDDDLPDDLMTTTVSRILLDLIGLTGQDSSGQAVLELQLGEIFTRTAVEKNDVDHYLAVTASLPKCEQPHYLPLPAAHLNGSDRRMDDVDFLWHADEGRYIVLRKIALRPLRDERAVMDAILETADIATELLAAVQTPPAEPKPS